MSNIKPGELRWYRWGDEVPGKASVWTINEKGEVKHLEEVDVMTAIHEMPYECSYP